MERHQNPQSRRYSWTVFACALVVLVVAGAEALRWAHMARSKAVPTLPKAVSSGRVALSELSRSHIPMPHGVPSAHASALTTLAGDRMLAFWWAGSRESGPDVKVYASRWHNGAWSPPWVVASRASLGGALGFGVRRIGNPVAWTDRAGRIHLYVVATGLGGWAASRVAHMISGDHGASFDVKRVLPMSPIFNTSVLVRTNPIGIADGGWWLPLYFEIGIKYPMLMAFDADGVPTWLGRIGESTTTLQPAIVPVSNNEVRAWMRDASAEQRVQQAASRDGGNSWEDLPPLELENHGTSVAVIRLTSGQYLMLHNPVGAGASSRSTLRLSISNDTHAWRTVADVARGPAGDEFSYPTMQQVGDELHVTYTHQRQSIAHHRYRISPGDTI